MRVASITVMLLTVGVAAVGRVRDGVLVEPPTVVVGAVDERPVRIPADDLDALAMAAAEAVDPVDDLSGSADYKRHVVHTFVTRILTRVVDGQERAA